MLILHLFKLMDFFFFVFICWLSSYCCRPGIAARTCCRGEEPSSGKLLPLRPAGMLTEMAIVCLRAFCVYSGSFRPIS